MQCIFCNFSRKFAAFIKILINGFIVFPAVVFFTAYVAFSEFSFETLPRVVYDYALSQVQNPPTKPDHLQTQHCIARTLNSDISEFEPLLCEKDTVIEVPVSELTKQAGDMIGFFYRLIVCMFFLYHVAVVASYQYTIYSNRKNSTTNIEDVKL
jgi:hypothetical protein